MIKVIHLLSTHKFSGAENVACQIINSFKNDSDFHMIYVSEIKENLEALKMRNIEYYELKKFTPYYVKKMILDLKPDIIHAHDIKASIMASMFKTKKMKVISHVHANHINMRKLNLKTFIYRIFSHRFSSVIWISSSAYINYYFNKDIKDKSKIIYNIISPTDLLKNIQKDKNLSQYDIIFLGRLVYQKNPIRFIKLIKKVKEKNDKIKVAIVGDGELYDECKKTIEEYELDKNVDLYGYVNNPYEILNNSKIMVMTSVYEGTPMSALEAIALGKPIVTTPTDGLIDIIKDGETGYFSDSDEILVKRIVELITDDNTYNYFSNNVKIYSNIINNVEEYKNKIIEIYKNN